MSTLKNGTLYKEMPFGTYWQAGSPHSIFPYLSVNQEPQLNEGSQSDELQVMQELPNQVAEVQER